MLPPKSFVLLIFIQIFSVAAKSQSSYAFWKDDVFLRRKYQEESNRKKQSVLSSLPEQHAKDYKAIYGLEFDAINDLWSGTRTVTAPDVNGYLQSIVKKIITANPQLQKTDARIVFCLFR